MLRIRINQRDFFVTVIMSLFFISQIMKGSMQTVVFFAMLAFSFFFAVFYKHSIWMLTFFTLTYQKALQAITEGQLNEIITYSDEVIESVVLIFIIIALARRQSKLSHIEQMILVTYALYILFMVLSTFFYKYRPTYTAILDLFVCAKFMIFYRGGAELSRQRVFSREKIFRALNAPCKIASVIIFVICIHDIFLPPFFRKYDYRYFMKSLRLCFLHPTYFAAVCLIIIAVLMLNMKFDKSNTRYIFLLALCTCFTFRTKAMAIVFIAYVLYFSFIKYNVKNKGIIVAGAIIGGIYFSYDQFIKYYTVQKVVPIRLKLITDGIKLAKQHFPFGAGLGTFGTTVAFDTDSPFYFKLGYMTGYYQGQPIGDGFWSGVFAEAGILGTIFFIICIILMSVDSIRRFREDKYAAWCMVTIIFYAIIASTAETAFYNPATALMFIIYGLASDRSSDKTKYNIDTGEFYDEEAEPIALEVSTE